jgi:capping protein beta
MEFIAALNITARLPPAEVETVVSNLSTFSPKLAKFLASRIDSRLQTLTDEATGKWFIASDFNRVGNAYRSPWSNEYTSSVLKPDTLYYPPDTLRRIELPLNELLLSYCNLYFENAVGSCFLAESQEPLSFFGVFQIKKDHVDKHSGESHTWESNHSFEVVRRETAEEIHVSCTMTSNVLVILDIQSRMLPSNLSGALSKSGTRSFIVPKMVGDSLYEETLIQNIGELMEDNESSLRGSIDQVCIPRCVDFAMASFGGGHDETISDSSSDIMEDDFRPRVSLGTMNPLHRQSVRPETAFQADLLGAIMQRRLKEDRAEGS